jgi:2-oxoisovalerate dehydrogenase E1 component alpha subunit
MKSHQPLRLHVPEPSARPGHETNFAYLHLAPAGAARCPPLDVKPAQTSDLAFNLVRVLDDEGRPSAPGRRSWSRPCCARVCAPC